MNHSSAGVFIPEGLIADLEGLEGKQVYAAALELYVKLAKRGRTTGGVIETNVRELFAMSSYGRPRAEQATQELICTGWISREQAHSGRYGRSVYRVHGQPVQPVAAMDHPAA